MQFTLKYSRVFDSLEKSTQEEYFLLYTYIPGFCDPFIQLPIHALIRNQGVAPDKFFGGRIVLGGKYHQPASSGSVVCVHAISADNYCPGPSITAPPVFFPQRAYPRSVCFQMRLDLREGQGLAECLRLYEPVHPVGGRIQYDDAGAAVPSAFPRRRKNPCSAICLERWCMR